MERSISGRNPMDFNFVELGGTPNRGLRLRELPDFCAEHFWILKDFDILKEFLKEFLKDLKSLRNSLRDSLRNSLMLKDFQILKDFKILKDFENP